MSGKRDQILIIEPPTELSFKGPFTQAVTSSMKLRNPSDKHVCFKIKTTAPRRYCVKPNSGVIDPQAEIAVAVSLQPFDYDPQDKNKHKFMVQSMFAPQGDYNQEQLWKEADSNELMDSKLRCVFVMPAGQEQNNIQENKSEPAIEVKPAASQPEIAKSGDGEQMGAAVQEIKKLNENLSQLRQENLILKEETMRLKRIAAASEKPDSSSYSSTTVTTVGPGEGLSTLYIYAALAILIIGIIFGKFFL
eukprot:TRINITY_DN11661_c0_g4_i1.p1 TRINITY_DN11661_c0_g4~~TRINITY_DN11661_c0_g4_i1.p1  ORF type:complete len:267 (-),score=57.87 TRINITY_DN11661_c0_g4_i1:589-1332(-)